jgi:hypothetical protein
VRLFFWGVCGWRPGSLNRKLLLMFGTRMRWKNAALGCILGDWIVDRRKREDGREVRIRQYGANVGQSGFEDGV